MFQITIFYSIHPTEQSQGLPGSRNGPDLRRQPGRCGGRAPGHHTAPTKRQRRANTDPEPWTLSLTSKQPGGAHGLPCQCLPCHGATHASLPQCLWTCSPDQLTAVCSPPNLMSWLRQDLAHFCMMKFEHYLYSSVVCSIVCLFLNPIQSDYCDLSQRLHNKSLLATCPCVVVQPSGVCPRKQVQWNYLIFPTISIWTVSLKLEFWQYTWDIWNQIMNLWWKYRMSLFWGGITYYISIWTNCLKEY